MNLRCWNQFRDHGLGILVFVCVGFLAQHLIVGADLPHLRKSWIPHGGGRGPDLFLLIPEILLGTRRQRGRTNAAEILDEESLTESLSAFLLRVLIDVVECFVEGLHLVEGLPAHITRSNCVGPGRRRRQNGV